MCLSCSVCLHSWFSDAGEMGVLEMGGSQIPPGSCFFFGEKAAHFLQDASVGVESVKYKMWDLLLPAHTLALNVIVLFCVQDLLGFQPAFVKSCRHYNIFKDIGYLTSYTLQMGYYMFVQPGEEKTRLWETSLLPSST